MVISQRCGKDDSEVLENRDLAKEGTESVDVGTQRP